MAFVSPPFFRRPASCSTCLLVPRRSAWQYKQTSFLDFTCTFARDPFPGKGEMEGGGGPTEIQRAQARLSTCTTRKTLCSRQHIFNFTGLELRRSPELTASWRKEAREGEIPVQRHVNHPLRSALGRVPYRQIAASADGSGGLDDVWKLRAGISCLPSSTACGPKACPYWTVRCEVLTGCG